MVQISSLKQMSDTIWLCNGILIIKKFYEWGLMTAKNDEEMNDKCGEGESGLQLKHAGTELMLPQLHYKDDAALFAKSDRVGQNVSCSDEVRKSRMMRENAIKNEVFSLE